MRPAVDDEAGGAGQVHPLEERRPSGHLPRGHEQIGAQDEEGAGPARGFDEEDLGAQAASFLST